MSANPAPTREQVIDALHDVLDPEIGYNIVDIGLIYEVSLDDGHLALRMTMTTPGCPAQDYIQRGVRERSLAVPGIDSVDIHLVWEPRWSVQKMSPEAKAHVGIA